jgi:glutathione S-transferase
MMMTGADFEEVVIPLRQEDTRGKILEYSPAAKVPALRTPEGVIWDSLAIAEYLAERFPEAGIWPADPWVRAQARAVVAEMHSGFAELRQHFPMAILEDHRDYGAGLERSDALQHDLDRIIEIWESCRARQRDGGAYLFGQQSAADAFFAPVASRFATFGVELPPLSAAYRNQIMSSPLMARWTEEARQEPWKIEFF